MLLHRKKKPAAIKKEGDEAEAVTIKEFKKSNHGQRKREKRQQGRALDPHLEEHFSSGRLLACIASRPGQCGRADGYILEGKELECYMKKLENKMARMLVLHKKQILISNFLILTVYFFLCFC